jgi:hypothetical protein
VCVANPRSPGGRDHHRPTRVLPQTPWLSVAIREESIRRSTPSSRGVRESRQFHFEQPRDRGMEESYSGRLCALTQDPGKACPVALEAMTIDERDRGGAKRPPHSSKFVRGRRWESRVRQGEATHERSPADETLESAGDAIDIAPPQAGKTAPGPHPGTRAVELTERRRHECRTGSDPAPRRRRTASGSRGARPASQRMNCKKRPRTQSRNGGCVLFDALPPLPL